MRFDELLTRPDGPAIAEELAALRRPARYVLEGIHQESRQKYWQFRVDVDEPAQTWTLVRQRAKPVSYRDGVLHDPDDGPDEISFARSMVSDPVVRMAVPDLMLRWGRGPESFHPILVEHIGEHSILVTFEHRGDPATRTTMVIDERDGIARRLSESGEDTIITSVRTAEPDEVLPRARFVQPTDWIRPQY
ncbi:MULTISPECIES: hypothetical protein [unclassified Curtobacterium]|uniref:hypothetical protein n=1 Tax=unclassified Curtobacterium TaxID=257496 RepID=UPI000F493D3E|nr:MULTISPECIES: hypothetical protein [unclassified Curtobacterium]ROQ05746.1 hypothetical protein EDF41_2552 [Curtobacterium sp. PhB171]ROQ23107.1 hypothetical protein EDF40_3119 [Curtobacterium sp. PhB170]ROS33941.1 hypothetical protein EDF25_2376 [Curtobacterium sp. PhB131]ROS66540.1 hypothetical protein EDF30_2503 [Curtobacterium sp. PhB141]